MKIAYLARVDIGKSSGVLKKIVRQIQFWKEAGHDVRLFALSRKAPTIWEGLSNIEVEYFETKNYFALLIQGRKAVAKIAAFDPDIVYWRYSSYYPGLKAILKKFPTFVEINSHYHYEYKMINKLGYLHHLLTYKKAFRSVKGFVVLTQELANWVSRFDHPILILGDSVALQSTPHFPAPDNVHPRLVCIASQPFPWIAIDKIFALADYFPKWGFDLVGLEADAARKFNVPPNVTAHGFLEGSEYYNILARADVAIGTLGLHRIQLEQMAPLKLREYLALGLPAIIAYQDTDFPGGAPFLLQLPNCEDNVYENITLIERFVNDWKGKRVARKAITHLGSIYKERKRLTFIKEIIKKV